jgi:acyl-CoA reductase-like NAD-dependent aldehyde dehydrogenase
MTRIERQRRIERLLGQIRDRVGELERLRMRGVRGRPLAEREEELSHVRERLAQIVAHASDDDARTTSSTGRTVVRRTPSGRSRRSIAHSAAVAPSS